MSNSVFSKCNINFILHFLCYIMYQCGSYISHPLSFVFDFSCSISLKKVFVMEFALLQAWTPDLLPFSVHALQCSLYCEQPTCLCTANPQGTQLT